MRTILLMALYQKNFALVLSLLKKMPLHLLKETDENGRTIAQDFAGEGMLEGLEYLANNCWTKTLLTDKDNKGCTPFISAVLNNQITIVEYLIEHQYDNFLSETHAAAFFGQLEKIKNLNKNDWNIKDSFNIDPTGYTIAAGQTEILKYLIENYPSNLPSNYPELFTIALELQHEETAQFLLSRISQEGFIKKISGLVKILAKSSANPIEILNKLMTYQFIPAQYEAYYYSCFIISAAVHNSLEIFTYFIQKFLKEKIYLSFPKTIADICTLIFKHKRFQFARVLAEEVLPVSLKLIEKCCYYFITNRDSTSLDIVLKMTKKFNAYYIWCLAYRNSEFHLLYYALQDQNPNIILTLRRHFSDNYFRESAHFFASKENFLIFLKDYLPTKNYEYIIDTPEHNSFIEAVNYLLALPKNPMQYYEIASKNLRLCCEMPLAHHHSFAEKTINLLHDIIEAYIIAQEFNWPLLEYIFSDIKYLALHANLPLEINYLRQPLKLTFVFSDYQATNEILDKLLTNQQYSVKEIFILHKISFLIAKICALLLTEIDFSSSADIKKLLLQEYINAGYHSPDFMSGLSLLMLLPKIQLTAKLSQQLCKNLNEITPEKINAAIIIGPLILPAEMANDCFQSLHILYNTLYQLKEWTDSITIERETFANPCQIDTNTLQHHLVILNSYENCYRVKIFLFQSILALINQLKNVEQQTTLMLSTDIKSFSIKNELENFFTSFNNSEFLKLLVKTDCHNKTFYQNSLISAQDDLAQLQAACLIAEEQLERLTAKKSRNKTQKPAKKLTKKLTPTLKNPKPIVKAIEPITTTYQPKIVINEENEPYIP